METSVEFCNQIPFPVKIFRKDPHSNLNVFVNLLEYGQRSIEAAAVNDTFIVSLAADSSMQRLTHRVGAQTHESVVIGEESLRSRPQGKKHRVHLSENMTIDLYRVSDQGTRQLLPDFIGVNPNQDVSVIENVQVGTFFVATPPGDPKTTLYWLYIGEDEDGTKLIFGRSFIRGVVSGGHHSFGVYGKQYDHYILPNGRLQLNQGEAVFYASKKCDKEDGDFWIFHPSTTDLQGAASGVPDTSIYMPSNNILPQSLRMGPNTVATVFGKPKYDDTGTDIESDQAIGDTAVASFRIKTKVDSAEVGIRVLTSLSQDHDDKGKDCTVYRTTLIVNDPDITRLYIESGEQDTDVEINGIQQTLQPDPQPTSVTPNTLRRVIITQDATKKLAAPSLFIRAYPTMPERERVVVHPAAELHSNLVNLKSDLKDKESRKALGLGGPDTLPDEACDAVQNALQNLARTALTTYHQNPQSVHSKQHIDGSHMKDSHWVLHKVDGKPTYTPGQDFYYSHTDSLEDAGHDTVDFDGGALSFWDDVTDVADDIASVAVTVVDTAEEAAEKALHATIELVKDEVTTVVKFVVNTARRVGAALESVIKAIKLAVEKLVEWIRFLFEWEDIVHTHDVIKSTVMKGVDQAVDYVGESNVRTNVTNFINGVKSNVDAELEELAKDLGGPLPATNSTHHSALEKLEWILNKVIQAISTSGAPGGANFGSELLEVLEHKLIPGMVDQAADIADLKQVIVDGDPKKIVAGLMGIAKDFTDLTFDSTNTIVDTGLQLVQDGSKQITGALEGDLHVPFLSFLYEALMNEKMSIVSIASLIYAVPVTVAYKIAEGEAPFKGINSLALKADHELDFINMTKTFIVSGVVAKTIWSIGRGKNAIPGNSEVVTKTLGLVGATFNMIGSAQNRYLARAYRLRFGIVFTQLGFVVLANRLKAKLNAKLLGSFDVISGALGIVYGALAIKKDEKSGTVLLLRSTSNFIELTGFTGVPQVYGAGMFAASASAFAAAKINME